MRYGIFSDVHSNLEALESVLQAYSAENIDKFFCVGDIVGYGANPAECITLLRKRGVITVAGNHDWAVADVISTAAFTPLAQKAVRWTAEHLESGCVQFLEELPLEYQEQSITLVHASLDDPAEFKYLASTTPVSHTFARMETPLCVVGHTHAAAVYVQKDHDGIGEETAREFTIEREAKYIINVGSVGQPRDRDPRAAYCVFDSDTGRCEIKRVAYDVQTARKKILDAGLPEILGERLVSGS